MHRHQTHNHQNLPALAASAAPAPANSPSALHPCWHQPCRPPHPGMFAPHVTPDLLPEELARVMGPLINLVAGLPEALQLQLLLSGTTTDTTVYVCAFTQALQFAYLTPHHMAVLKP
ncbi:hypothetical protein Vafri_8768 [Volvox africanus]|uniref:Uncharacterized protein n=1 Tax=Volvox africanus TaxID=51714 RepID=A0A8J4F0P7_9CHLO|nr:hypothetical protein Vafri_8768 [Volvox africanus]